MKKITALFSIVLLFFFSIIRNEAKACHAIALVNVSITVLGNGINCNASSDSPTCGCGNYWMDVEVQCNGCPFNNSCTSGTGYGPFVSSGPGCYGSAQMVKNNCVVQAYPTVFIPFNGLCPGLTYKVRMREHHGTANPPVGPWSATFTFTVPGTPPTVSSSATASPTTICPPQSTQLNATSSVNPTCPSSSCPVTYSWVPTTGLSNPNIQNPTASPTVTTTYTVYFNGGCVPIPPATVTVSISPPPVAGTASVNPTSVCAGQNVTLTLSGYSGNIQWQSGPTSTGPWTNIPGGTTSPYVFGPVTSNICFHAVVTNSCGTATSNSVCVTLLGNATISVAPAAPSYCVGGSVVLTASGANTYVWSPATNLSSTTGSTVTANPTATTTYTVTGTTSSGCTGTATVTVTVNPLPTVTINPSSPSICVGSSTVLTASGASTYAWAPSTGLSCTTCANPTANPTVTTTYTVTGTSAQGCTDTEIVTVTVNPLPTITVNPANPAYCTGGNVNLTASGANTYSWSPATGLNQTTGATVNASPTVTTTYTVTGTSAQGCTSTTTVTVTVSNNFVATATPDDTICSGSSINLTTSAGQSYSWSPATGLSCTTCQNPVASPTATTTYSVLVTAASGCTGTAQVTITVSPPITLAIAGFAETCTGACDGQAVVIPSGGIGGPFFLWSNGGTTASINNVCAGNYSVVVTDGVGCTATASTNVPAAAPLVLTASTTTAHCNLPDGSATVNASGGTGSGYTYSWTSTPSQATATASNLTPGTYCCYVYDGNMCLDTICVTVPNAAGVAASIQTFTPPLCFGGSDGSATATGTGGVAPYTYNWSTTPSQTTPTATGLSAGTYTCTITDSSGCTDTAIVVITQPSQVTVAPMAPQTICIGQCVTLTATGSGGNPGYSYSWNVNNTNVCPVVTTTYSVVATDANGCTSAVGTVTITVNPALTVNASNNAGICPGSTTTLNATASGGGGSGYGYSWAPATGLSCTQCQSPVASPTVTTTYTVYASDNCGTPLAVDSVVVTVYPLPVVTISSDTNQGCVPLCINLVDQTTISSGLITGWNWTMTGSNTMTTSTQQNPQGICYNIPGSYNITLVATSNFGCTATVSTPYQVTAFGLPSAGFSMSPQPTTILSPTICFTDSSSANITSWSWDFGDPMDQQNTSTLQNPCHLYSDTGTYCVSLTVTNANGCVDSITYCLRIDPDFVIFVPNAFTPNGDGMNDLFIAEGTGIDPLNFKMWIFDRWGNNLFYTEKLDKGWDGTMAGNDLLVQEDVYVWKIQLHDFQGNKHEYVGHVSVIK